MKADITFVGNNPDTTFMVYQVDTVPFLSWLWSYIKWLAVSRDWCIKPKRKVLGELLMHKKTGPDGRPPPPLGVEVGTEVCVFTRRLSSQPFYTPATIDSSGMKMTR